MSSFDKMKVGRCSWISQVSNGYVGGSHERNWVNRRTRQMPDEVPLSGRSSFKVRPGYGGIAPKLAPLLVQNKDT